MSSNKKRINRKKKKGGGSNNNNKKILLAKEEEGEEMEGKEKCEQENSTSPRGGGGGGRGGYLYFIIALFVVIVAITLGRMVTTYSLETNSTTSDDERINLIVVEEQQQQQQQQEVKEERTIEIEKEKKVTTIYERPDPRFAFFLTQVCKVAYCNLDYLRAENRSFRATKTIIPTDDDGGGGSSSSDQQEEVVVLFKIPRSIQIWDLDALRDPFIRKHLFHAHHKESGNSLGREAYLAAYLALEMANAKMNNNHHSQQFDPVRLAYFDLLPTFDEIRKIHPFFSSTDTIVEHLGRSTTASLVFYSHQKMIVSEYEAFVKASNEFQNLVKPNDYYTARLHVLSRALPVGPPSPEEAHKAPFSNISDQDLIRDEAKAYQDLFGFDLMDEEQNGSIALIPIADMFNHHTRNTVEFKFQRRRRTDNNNSSIGEFIMTTTEDKAIMEGYEPMISYGAFSDAQLFAKYGFVNSDGSGQSEVSLAFLHDVLLVDTDQQYKLATTRKFLPEQKKQVAQYLRFDDGYSECIPGPLSHPEEAELKKLKFDHLLKISNDSKRWHMVLPPRNMFSSPPKSIYMQQTNREPFAYVKDSFQEHSDFSHLLSTCRLMSVINSDYDGKVVDILKENIDDESFILERGNEDLEFRSWMCLARWLGTKYLNIEKDKGSLVAIKERVKHLDATEYGSKRWKANRVCYGEVQALKAAVDFVMQRVKSTWGLTGHKSTKYFIRENRCPASYLDYLFRSEDSSPVVES